MALPISKSSLRRRNQEFYKRLAAAKSDYIMQCYSVSIKKQSAMPCESMLLYDFAMMHALHGEGELHLHGKINGGLIVCTATAIISANH